MMNILSDKIVNIRKPHKCDACGRMFEKGTKMRRQVNTGEGMCQWYECQTCQILLAKYCDDFDDGYGECEQYCVANTLNVDQTPEDLLASYEK